MPVIVAFGMSDIEESLEEEKEDEYHVCQRPLEGSKIYDKCLSRHQDTEEVKEDKHAVIEEESADRIDDTDDESNEDDIIFLLLGFHEDGWDGDKKIWEDEVEEFFGGIKTSRSHAAPRRGRDRFHHARELKEF